MIGDGATRDDLLASQAETVGGDLTASAPSLDLWTRSDPRPAPTTLDRLLAAQFHHFGCPRPGERVHSINAVMRRHVVVLDDNPTGSQVVHDVPVLTRWDDSDLRWAFAHPARHVLRPDATPAAWTLTTTETPAAGSGLEDPPRRRGDRNERGAAEPERLDAARALPSGDGRPPARRRSSGGRPYDAVVLAPAYLEAGRVTVDDVHYVRQGDDVRARRPDRVRSRRDLRLRRARRCRTGSQEKTGSEVPAAAGTERVADRDPHRRRRGGDPVAACGTQRGHRGRERLGRERPRGRRSRPGRRRGNRVESHLPGRPELRARSGRHLAAEPHCCRAEIRRRPCHVAGAVSSSSAHRSS